MDCSSPCQKDANVHFKFIFALSRDAVNLGALQRVCWSSVSGTESCCLLRGLEMQIITRLSDSPLAVRVTRGDKCYSQLLCYVT
eukprot:1581011-Amphidinium_carterae.1